MDTHVSTDAVSESAEARLYLDDLREGQRFSGRSHALDEAQIKGLAARFNPQPFHLSETAARASIFSGLAASGWHTAAFTMRSETRNQQGEILQILTAKLIVPRRRSAQ
jgi:acyl dehydratase